METKYNPFDNYKKFEEYLLETRRIAVNNTSDINIEQIIEDVTGLKPNKKADLNQSISGQIELCTTHKTYKISVNKNDHYYRQRFTMAHELAHYILHRNYLGLGVDDNIAYRSVDTGRFNNQFITSEMEQDANKFASWLLMPFDLIKKFQIDLNISDLSKMSLDEIVQLSKKLKVSKEALDIRLKNLQNKNLI